MVARNHAQLPMHLDGSLGVESTPPSVLSSSPSSHVTGLGKSALPSLAQFRRDEASGDKAGAAKGGVERRNVMRKLMTNCIKGSLREWPNMVRGADIREGKQFSFFCSLCAASLPP